MNSLKVSAEIEGLEEVEKLIEEHQRLVEMLRTNANKMQYRIDKININLSNAKSEVYI